MNSASRASTSIRFHLSRHATRGFRARLGSAEAGRPPLRFSETALRALQNYNWPGNVRELENVIQRLTVMNDGDLVEAPDLPQLMRFSALRKTSLSRTLAEVEREYTHNVLQSVGGNKTQAAEILGIDRKTLRSKLGSAPKRDR